MSYKYGKWTDRIADKLNLNKQTWAHIVIAVGIAVAMSAAILLTTTPRKSAYDADMVRHAASIENLAITVGGLAEQDEATASQISGITSTVTGHTDDIISLETRANETDSRIDAVRADMQELVCSPPEAHLTGTFGSYKLHARTSVAGNFSANVHLVYSPPVSVGNATSYDGTLQAFHAGINWTATTLKAYIPVPSYNGTAWGISQVWFNIGTFVLAANNDTSINIAFTGLNSTYEPDFAYVEVFPILK